MRALVLAAAAATLTACGSSEPEAPPAAAPADELAAVVEPLEATPEVIEESAAMSTMNGTVTYLMRRALHPEAVIRVRLEDISRADAPATVLAETRPAIWWGAIMVVFGGIFLGVGRRADNPPEEDA